MFNIRQQEPYFYNGYYGGGNIPLSYEAYCSNRQVVYNPNFHGGFNPNFYGGFNPNFYGGFNPNFPGGFNVNHYGAFNGYSPQNISTNLNKIKSAKGEEDWCQDSFSRMEKILGVMREFIASLETIRMMMADTIRFSVCMRDNRDKFKLTFNFIWKSLKLYKLFRWLYVKFLNLLGCQVPLQQEDDAISPTSNIQKISYGVLAFLGATLLGPYLISHWFESTTEDPMNPIYWRHSGYPVKVIQDFVADATDKMTVQINDKLIVAPKVIQSEMNLDDTEFVFASHNDRCGLVPVKHLTIEEPEQTQTIVMKDNTDNLEDQVGKSTS